MRHSDDIKAFIVSKLTGYLADGNDLNDAMECLFEKSGGSFVYIVSVADKFEGDKRWTNEELEKMPHGLDNVYRGLFALILNQRQEKEIPYNVDKVS